MANSRGNQCSTRKPASAEIASRKRLEETGTIFSVNHDGIDYYPRYEFDAAYRPLPIIGDLLKEFAAESDTWKIAAWFHFPNGYLRAADTPGGRQAISPKDALDQRDKLMEAVRSRKGTYVA